MHRANGSWGRQGPRGRRLRRLCPARGVRRLRGWRRPWTVDEAPEPAGLQPELWGDSHTHCRRLPRGGRRGVRGGCRLRGRAQAGAGRDAAAAAEPNIGNFNSPLEMPDRTPNEFRYDASLRVSILHWRCFLKSQLEGLVCTEIVKFQFSIGDARQLLQLCVSSHRDDVSILHWRCPLSLPLWPKTKPKSSFNYPLEMR